MKRTWYLLALVPLAIGGAIGAILFIGMLDDIKAMQRVVVPGETELTLEAGDYVAYGEAQSEIDGVAYINQSFRVSCAMAAADGTPVKLETAGSKVSYTLGGYQGESMFEFTVPASGTYRFGCQGDDDPAVIAIGRGVGTGIVLAVLAFVGGLIGAIVVFFVVRRKRKRAKMPA